jgi:hypothetical protein
MAKTKKEDIGDGTIIRPFDELVTKKTTEEVVVEASEEVIEETNETE